MTTEQLNRLAKEIAASFTVDINDLNQHTELVRGVISKHLLDSQAAGDPVSYYNEDGSYNPVGKNIADHAATTMRSRCVEKVREYGKSHSLCHPIRSTAAGEIVELLEAA